jgi:diguanylate cyclase (GGDEF)-like protein/PAS domain S-box-containing protein
MKRRLSRQRSNLPAGLAVLFGFMVIFAGGFFARQYTEVIERTGEIAAMHARAMEGFLTHGIETATLVAASLEPTDDGDLRDGDVIRGLPLVRSVSYIDTDGRIIASTNPRNVGVLVPIDDMLPRELRLGTIALGGPWHGRDFASGVPARSDVEHGERDLGFVPVFAVASHDGHQHRLLIALNTDFLQTHFSENLPVDTGRIDVLRYDSVLLVSSAPHQRPGEIDRTVRDSFDLSHTEFGRLPDADGAFIGHVHASPTLPLAVVARLDRGRALDAWRDTALTMAAVVAVAGLAIAVLAAVFMHRRDQLNAQRHAIERLRRVNAACVFSNAREAILITDARGTITDANDSFQRLTGHSRDEAVGHRIGILRTGHHGTAFWRAVRREIDANGYWHGEMRLRRRDGGEFVALQTISAVRDDDGVVRQYVALFTDVTLAREQAARLERAAHYDALTSLPNRVLLTARLEDAMVDVRAARCSLAVVFIDIDGFKTINDTLGHSCGDEFLVATGLRLKTVLRHGDVLGRLGGDEFVAVLRDVRDTPDCSALARRLLDAVRMPITLRGREVSVSASIGMTFYGGEEQVDADQLLRQADQAMYQAKIAGKDRHEVFDAEKDRSAREYHETLEEVREAFETDRFVLLFQPIVDLTSGRPIAMEALIRWRHPTRGLIPPSRFIPLIEGNPIAVPIGEWVIETALAELDRWLDAGLDMRVAVNVSGIHLQAEGFTDRLAWILAGHGERVRGHLEIEIPEAVAFTDMNRITEVIGRCRDLGVRIALDDFGTGYSSLAYLERLPLDVLKIDRAFVADMGKGPRSRVILEAILDLSKKFGYVTVAEGIERDAQWDVLAALGCDFGQGFLIARPMPADEVVDWAMRHDATEARQARKARGRVA